VEAREANYVKQDRLNCFVDIHTRRNHKGEIFFLSQCILFRCQICYPPKEPRKQKKEEIFSEGEPDQLMN
jgi:hypothetical protein